MNYFYTSARGLDILLTDQERRSFTLKIQTPSSGDNKTLISFPPLLPVFQVRLMS